MNTHTEICKCAYCLAMIRKEAIDVAKNELHDAGWIDADFYSEPESVGTLDEALGKLYDKGADSEL